MTGKKGQRSSKAVMVAKSTKFKPGFHKKMDGRTRMAKRIRSRIAQLVSDQGGLENMSYMRRTLCERAVFVDALIAEAERKLMTGIPIDEGAYRGHVNSLIGLARTLGLDRVAASVPRALDYAAQLSHEESP